MRRKKPSKNVEPGEWLHQFHLAPLGKVGLQGVITDAVVVAAFDQPAAEQVLVDRPQIADASGCHGRVVDDGAEIGEVTRCAVHSDRCLSLSCW